MNIGTRIGLQHNRRFSIRLVKSFIDLIILMALDDGRMSAYDMVTLVYERFGIPLRPRTVCQKLSALEKTRLIEAVNGNQNRTYKLTEEGEALTHCLLTVYAEFQGEASTLFKLLRDFSSLGSKLLKEFSDELPAFCAAIFGDTITDKTATLLRSARMRQSEAQGEKDRPETYK